MTTESGKEGQGPKVPPPNFPPLRPTPAANPAGSTEAAAATPAAAPRTEEPNPSTQQTQPTNQPTGASAAANPATATTTPPVSPPSEAGAQNQKPEDPGSGEVKIEKAIRWRVEDPFLFLQMGGLNQVTKTILAYDESITREIATKIEMKPLIGLKGQVGKRIRQCFRKGHEQDEGGVVEAHIEPWKSIIACILFVLIGLAWTFDLLPFIPDAELALFPSICLSAIFIGLGLAGWKDIEEAHMGVLTILGRRQRIFASEGHHWVLWPFMSYSSVGIHERLIERRGNDAIVVVAGSAEDAGSEMPESIAEKIDESFRDVSGVNVLEVLNPKIVPANEALLRAWEKKEMERAESEAQDLDMRRQGLRAAALKAQLPDLPGIEALRAVQAQEEDISRDETIVTINGTGDLDRFGGLLIGVAQKLGLVKQGGSGGGKKKHRNNRQWKKRDNQQGGQQK